MKAKVTWKGEEGNDQKELKWGTQTFKKDEAVEISNPTMIKKAQGNQFFEVQVTEQDAESTEGEAYRPPSNTTSPQHPAPKPGEPIPPRASPQTGTIQPSRK
jgi:hypothetical protein